jgi:hypothetical protein
MPSAFWIVLTAAPVEPCEILAQVVTGDDEDDADATAGRPVTAIAETAIATPAPPRRSQLLHDTPFTLLCHP